MTETPSWWPHEPSLSAAFAQWSEDRLAAGPPDLHSAPSPAELAEAFGSTITDGGLGGAEAFRLFAEVLAPSCLVTDHPRFLAFVPSAPAPAAGLLDSVLGMSAIFGGSWVEGSGSVHAENAALRWLADLVEMPSATRGVFVSGGCAGNLNALMVARERWRENSVGRESPRAVVLVSDQAHSSIGSTARLLDIGVEVLATDSSGRLDRAAVESWSLAAPEESRSRVCAVVATAGTTNVGVVDDLDAAADLAGELGTWLHIDGAYGAAAVLDDRYAPLFSGIGRADSLIVDPHKWLFAPLDVCALLYRDVDFARAVHTQHAEYLDPILDDASFNPSDLAYHLSRRSRGLPLWFALATYGTAVFRAAVTESLDLARDVAAVVRDLDHVELVCEPGLSVVVFRRVGWSESDCHAWSERALADGTGFVLPTEWKGETVFRLCFTNPATSMNDVSMILESMRGVAG